VPTVDGHEWARKRIRFLEELLGDDPTDEQRSAIEAELNELRSSSPRWRRWLWPIRLPHER
jgi:hypothetical protein